MLKVINVRGTNGSGKSTLVRSLMARAGNPPIIKLTPDVDGHRNMTLTVVGKYKTDCGGCDQIKTFGDLREGLRAAWEFRPDGLVLFEGVLLSTVWKTTFEISQEVRKWNLERFGVDQGMVWAFMCAPVETCLARVRARNGGKPINEDAVLQKYTTMTRHITKIAAEVPTETAWTLDATAKGDGLINQFHHNLLSLAG